MHTITPERAAELKAAAIAARRATRAPWQNAHVDRLDREREARRISKEYREAERQAVKATGLKRCSACGELLPLDSFSPAHRDRPTARCKTCAAAATRARYHSDLAKARSRTRNRPPPDPERQRQRARRADERQRKVEERERAKAERERERQADMAERIAGLSALLSGTADGERIVTQERWDVATSELRRLWLQCGDKTCVACKATVPPTAMLPPGPANFYPGKCQPCAHAESLANHLRVIGRPFEGAPPIRLRDGSTISIGEFARRHRERERGSRQAR